MAVLKNGKLIGKVGNVVYREVNGKLIVQSRPRPRKGGFKLTSRNSNFAAASKAASRLYAQMKDFALNQTTRDLYSSLVRLFMERPEALQADNKDEDWSLIPDSHLLPVEKRSNWHLLMEDELVSEIADGKCYLEIPALATNKKPGPAHRAWKEAREFEVTNALIYYDVESESATVVERWLSGRFPKSAGSDPIVFEYELKDFKEFPISSGLLLLSAGIKFYASSSSDSYLNCEEFNPFVIAGIWKKH